MPESPPSEMQIYEFGKLPLAYQGRVKPYDTLARNTLQILSGRQEVYRRTRQRCKTQHKDDCRPSAGCSTRSPAPTSADDHPIFRIENLDLLDALGLEPPRRFCRYSLERNHSNEAPARSQIARSSWLAT